MKGGKIAMQSSDPVNHNVNVKLSKLKLNLTISPGTSAPPLVLKNEENRPGDVVCDIHSWMKAYIMVVGSPYFAVTDSNGNFEIKNLPAGTQNVVVWQEAVQGGFLTTGAGMPVEIQPNAETTKDFSFDAAKLAPMP
jgi:hypothetical protein